MTVRRIRHASYVRKWLRYCFQVLSSLKESIDMGSRDEEETEEVSIVDVDFDDYGQYHSDLVSGDELQSAQLRF